MTFLQRSSFDMIILFNIYPSICSLAAMSRLIKIYSAILIIMQSSEIRRLPVHTAEIYQIYG